MAVGRGCVWSSWNMVAIGRCQLPDVTKQSRHLELDDIERLEPRALSRSPVSGHMADSAARGSFQFAWCRLRSDRVKVDAAYCR